MSGRPTPETDAAIVAAGGDWSYYLGKCSRKLERERDEAREQRDCLHELHNKNAIQSKELLELCGTLRKERDEAREELKKLEGAYEDATNYYARMIELREELDQVKEELKNKTYDKLKS